MNETLGEAGAPATAETPDELSSSESEKMWKVTPGEDGTGEGGALRDAG